MGGQNDEDLLDCKCLLAECFLMQRKHIEAAPYAIEALEGLETNLKRGPEHHITLRCRALRAVILQKEGKLKESQAMAQSTRQSLEAVQHNIEKRMQQGGCKSSEVERRGLLRVNEVLALRVVMRNKSWGK